MSITYSTCNGVLNGGGGRVIEILNAWSTLMPLANGGLIFPKITLLVIISFSCFEFQKLDKEPIFENLFFFLFFSVMRISEKYFLQICLISSSCFCDSI